jgi:hypothetical protein
VSLRTRIQKARTKLRRRRQRRHDAKPRSERRRKLAAKVRFWHDALEKRKARLEKQRQLSAQSFSPIAGAPHWGGSQDVILLKLDPVALTWDIGLGSNKRTETFGNPGSDHHTSQVLASARDYLTNSNFAFRNALARALGIESVIYDFSNYYFYLNGIRFRAQFIAATHGTGPHCHAGIRRA